VSLRGLVGSAPVESGARPPEGRAGATVNIARGDRRPHGRAAVENILSVLDGKPICDNVVNKEVLD